MKRLVEKFLPLVDIVLVPFVYPSALLLKTIRRVGMHRLVFCKSVLINIGVFPIRNHYYEPQFDNRSPNPDFSEDRKLPGIDWNVSGQLQMLKLMVFSDELDNIPRANQGQPVFYFNNGAFESGDAEYWYQLIRVRKPKRIFEIGSGNSTLMAVKAINRNRNDDPSYACKHICIEPYEMPWLEKVGVSLVRKRVEDLDLSFFSELQENDILFIDSSHIIRPQGYQRKAE